jgi:hypothetical protein
MPIPDIVVDNPTVDAQWWIKAAQGSIRCYCGWHVTPEIDDTLKVDAYGGSILTLPTKHVNSITSVLVDGRELSDQIDWSVAGTIQLRSGSWPDRPGSVTVKLNHGYPRDEVPEIAELLRTLAKRARSQPGISSQSVNGASVSYLTYGGTTLGVQLLQIEKDMLEPYRLNWGPR